MRIYLDANFFIRLIEGDTSETAEFFARAVENDHALITSELTLLETLTGSIRDRDDREIAAYEDILTPGGSPLDVRPIDRGVLRRAAAVRVDLHDKTPDAIHVATAMEAGCDVFVSSDRKLRVPTGMRKVSLEELGGLA